MLLNMINFTAYMKKIDKKKIVYTQTLALKNFHIHHQEGFFCIEGDREKDREHMIFFETLLTNERGMKYKCQCG